MLIYIVDDSFGIIDSVGKWLRMKQWDVRAFSGSQPLFVALETLLPHLILLDIMLGPEDGRDVCKEIKKRHGNKVPVILFSSAYQSYKELKDTCADDFIQKGIRLRELTDILHRHIATK